MNKPKSKYTILFKYSPRRKNRKQHTKSVGKSKWVKYLFSKVEFKE